jgi:DnaK suppressor protein
MADEIDLAQDAEERFRNAALRRLVAKINSAPRVPLGDERECIDCGDDIPPERITAAPSATRCVQCQARRERQGRT